MFKSTTNSWRAQIKSRNLRPIMKREIKKTADGSHTLFVPEMDEHFHSVHGALQESMHVFIQTGLKACQKEDIYLFEVGFGTGLNALLTLANQGHKKIHYYSIEKYPLNTEEYEHLNFSEFMTSDLAKCFPKLHDCEWNQTVEISPGFEFCKIQGDLTSFDFTGLPQFDLIYFDAFAPNKQADMWDEQIFQKLAANCNAGAIIVTYCAQGEVRRKMMRSGFEMQRLAGPPGKKEMLYGEKTE